MAEDIRPQDAIRAAKKWLADVYADEQISQVGLEGVRWRDGQWEITIGFSRAAVEGVEMPAVFHDLYRPRQRTFKVLVIDPSDYHVMEMKDREAA